MKRIDGHKNAILLFQCLVIFLPFVEIYRSFWHSKVSIGPLAVEEVFLGVAVGVLFIAAVWYAWKNRRKALLMTLGAHLAVFFLYLVLHARTAAAFDPSLLPGAAPDFFREAYYVARMYLLPTLLFWSAVLLELPAEKLRTAMTGCAWVLSSAIVLTTLFGVAFASYADGNVRVAGGYFSWFSLESASPFHLYTSKGPFHSANDLASALFGLTPFAAFNALRRGKARDYALLVLVGLASVTVGTKIAFLGFFLACAALLAGRAFEWIVCRDAREGLRCVALTLLAVLLVVPALVISPGRRLQSLRDEEEKNAFRSIDSAEEMTAVVTLHEEPYAAEEIEKLAAYLDENHYDHFIDPWFLELYPVSFDPAFWAQAVLRPNVENMDARAFKLEMIERIIERDGKSADRAFGIGFTSGVPYAERDYLYQLDLYGVCGVIVLFAPLAAALAAAACSFWRATRRRQKCLDVFCAALSLATYLATAYFAGHVFDTPFVTYLVFSVAALCASGRIPNENE